MVDVVLGVVWLTNVLLELYKFTVYPVIAEPLSAGAVHETLIVVAVLASTLALGFVGTAGAFGTVASAKVDDADFPFPLFATIKKEYVTPAAKPETVVCNKLFTVTSANAFLASEIV